jgi:hypothetical protein
MNRLQAEKQDEEAPERHKAKLAFLSLDLLTTDPSNARKHSRAQIRDIAKSCEHSTG